jgi:hypothetical protein
LQSPATQDLGKPAKTNELIPRSGDNSPGKVPAVFSGSASPFWLRGIEGFLKNLINSTSRLYTVGAVVDMSKHQIEHDIELTRKIISENGMGLVAIKEGKVLIQAQDRGVRPFVQAVMDLGEKLRGAVIGDRVMGRASAMLCIYSGAVAVYTPLVSDAAVEELRVAHIKLVADEKTPRILNRDGTDVCPFEKMTETFKSSHEVFHALVGFFEDKH